MAIFSFGRDPGYQDELRFAALAKTKGKTTINGEFTNSLKSGVGLGIGAAVGVIFVSGVFVAVKMGLADKK